MLLHIVVDDVSFYQILKHKSNNDIRKGNYYNVSFDHIIK